MKQTSLKMHISVTQKRQMEELLRARLIPHGIARRVSAVLLLGAGASLRATRAQTGLNLRHIVKWRERFVQSGVQAKMGSRLDI